MMRRLSLPDGFGALYVCTAPETEAAQSAAAHAMLRKVLPLYANEHGIALNGDPMLLRSDMGKPYFAGLPGIFVNIAHCRGLAAVLLSACECGVDVESVRPLREKVVRRVFSDEEQRALSEAADPDRLFTRLWTLKESYVKAIGIGISYPMREVSFTLGRTITCTKPDAAFCQLDEGEFILSACILTIPQPAGAGLHSPAEGG